MKQAPKLAALQRLWPVSASTWLAAFGRKAVGRTSMNAFAEGQLYAVLPTFRAIRLRRLPNGSFSAAPLCSLDPLLSLDPMLSLDPVRIPFLSTSDSGVC